MYACMFIIVIVCMVLHSCFFNLFLMLDFKCYCSMDVCMFGCMYACMHVMYAM